MAFTQPREDALFRAAAELRPDATRRAFLDQVCAGDPALRQRLEALLAAHKSPETLLASQVDRPDEVHESPSSNPSQVLTELSSPRDVPDEATGQTLGPVGKLGAGRHKLLERIGEGGCGVVLCRRADRTRAAARGAQGDQAGHGHRAGRRAVRSRAAGTGHDGSSEHRDPQATAVLAMAQPQGGQPDAARASLARAVELVGKLAKLESRDLGDDGLDWIMAPALLREAKGLIEADTKPTEPNEKVISTTREVRP